MLSHPIGIEHSSEKEHLSSILMFLSTILLLQLEKSQAYEASSWKD